MSGFHPKDLIAEIKCRPGIYNKELLEHPRRDNKHQLWLEVGEKLTPQEDWDSYTDVEKDARIDEIQAKWKHLKDHFYREIKVIQTGSAKKRKYVYFDDMEFMRPFVGFKLPPLSKMKTDSNSMDESLMSTTQVEFKMSDTEYVMEELLKDPTEDDAKEEVVTPRRQSLRPAKPTPKAMARKPLSASKNQSKDQKVIIKNFDGIRKTNVHPASSTSGSGGTSSLPSFKIRDGDISFCLSLVPTFRKLSDSSKLRAKIEVLKILHKFVEHVERNKPPTITRVVDEPTDEHDLIQEDFIQDEDGDVEEAVNVKHEHDDPLNNTSGNTKAWWT